MRRLGVELADDPANLLQLFHQVVFGVQAASGVGDQHVDATGLGGLYGIEDHRSGVGAGVLGDHRDLVTLAPYLQLLDRSGTEGVASSQHHFLAFELQLLGQFADGGGLAGAVHTDHQDHIGLVLRLYHQRLLDRAQQRSQFFLQRLVQGIGVGQLLAGNLLGQVLDDGGSGFHANVGGQQSGFDFVEQVVIDDFLAQEQAGHALADAGAGLRQALLEAGEEAGLGLLGLRGDRGCSHRGSRLWCRAFRDGGRRFRLQIRHQGHGLFGNRQHQVADWRDRLDDRGRLDRGWLDRGRLQGHGRDRLRCRCHQWLGRDRLGFRGLQRLGSNRFGDRGLDHRGLDGCGDLLRFCQLWGRRGLNGLRGLWHFGGSPLDRSGCRLLDGWGFIRGHARFHRLLRLLAKPAEQAFLLTSLGRRFFVVVGTKHGRRLSQGSDGPAMAHREFSLRRTDYLEAGWFMRNVLS
ncbi:hypothetical protein D3C80_451250 [compost metagenome]